MVTLVSEADRPVVDDLEAILRERGIEGEVKPHPHLDILQVVCPEGALGEQEAEVRAAVAAVIPKQYHRSVSVVVTEENGMSSTGSYQTGMDRTSWAA